MNDANSIINSSDVISGLPAPKKSEDLELVLEKLDPAQQEIARQLADAISVDRTSEIPSFGADAQKELGKIAEEMLKGTTTQALGEVGGNIEELLRYVKQVDIEQLKAGGGRTFFRRILVRIKSFFDKYQEVNAKIQQIEARLFSDEQKLTTSINQLDLLYKENFQTLQKLRLWIAAGKIKLNELYESYSKLKEEASQGKDQDLIQKTSDLGNFITRFERRIAALQLVTVAAYQSGPSIRVVQENDLGMKERIILVRDTVLPYWRRQLALAAKIYELQGAAAIQKKITETSTAIITGTAEMLHDASVDVATIMESDVLDINALEQANDKLIQTLQEVAEIHKKGKEARQLITERGNEIEKRLDEALLEAKSL